jgi:hypothetical protein
MFEFEESDLVHSYSRADALRDGGLVDVSATAKVAGFKNPVALAGHADGQCRIHALIGLMPGTSNR